MYLLVIEGISCNSNENTKPSFIVHAYETLDEAIIAADELADGQKRIEQHVNSHTVDCVKKNIRMSNEYFKFYNILYIIYTRNEVSSYMTKRFVIEI